jgi:hypothetical protein
MIANVEGKWQATELVKVVMEREMRWWFLWEYLGSCYGNDSGNGICIVILLSDGCLIPVPAYFMGQDALLRIM